MAKKVGLAVVVPFYNEAGNLPLLHRRLEEALSAVEGSCEVIYVDDGSSDNSVAQLLDSASKDREVKLIQLRRHQGQTAATAAGIDASSAELVAFLDADLQNDPADIPKLLSQMNKGTDAVFGWRRLRYDSWDRVLVSRLANWLVRRLFDIKLHDLGCSLRVVRREVLNRIKLYGETHRILPILILLQGAKYREIEVAHQPRRHEKSKYGYSRSIKVIIDLITVKFLDSFGTKPAYVFGGGGIASLVLSGITLLAVAYRKLFLGVFVHRDPLFIIAIVLLLAGLQMILMGLLAELLVRVYFESSHKPIYEVKEQINF